MNQAAVSDAMKTVADRMASNIHRSYMASEGRGKPSATYTEVSRECPEVKSSEGQQLLENVFRDALNGKFEAAGSTMTCSAFDIYLQYDEVADTLHVIVDPQCRK